jgi:hypothetical protein
MTRQKVVDMSQKMTFNLNVFMFGYALGQLVLYLLLIAAGKV